MKTVTIDVIDQDIKVGTRRNAFFCPIARAANRALGGHGYSYSQMHVQVGDNLLGFRFGKPVFLSPQAIKFMEDFDTGNPVVPFSFRVAIADNPQEAAAVASLLLA